MSTANPLRHLRASTAHKRPAPASMADGQLALNTNDGSPGLFFKNSNGALVKVGPVHVGTTAPNASPASGGTAGNSIGEQWLDTTGGTYVFKIWDGTVWRSEAGEFVSRTGSVMTGALGIIAGTAAAPSIYVSGDTNTGIHSPSADTLAVTTAGVQKFAIDSFDGNPIIETSYPTVRPTLDLNFAQTKRLDPRVTFSRSSSAIFVDSNGVLQSAVTNVPRFDHNPATGESLGLLVEEARTNYRRYSNTFSDGSYIKGYFFDTAVGRSLVTPGQSDSPLGPGTGWKLEPDPSANASFLSSTRLEVWSDYIPSGNTKVLSIFAKAGTAGTRLTLHPANDEHDKTTFNLESGTVVSGPGSIQNYGNGWYRCSAASSVNVTSSRNFQIHAVCSSYSDFIYISGCQFEAGPFPTSYISTGASAVTRSADVAQITGTNFSSWFNRNNGTLLCNAQNLNAEPNPPMILTAAPYYQGAGGYKLGLAGFWSSVSQLTTDAWANGVGLSGSIMNISETQAASATIRHSFAYSPTECRACAKQTLGTVGGSQCFQAAQGLDRLLLQQYFSVVSSRISRLTYWPTRLSDATLQTITR